MSNSNNIDVIIELNDDSNMQATSNQQQQQQDQGADEGQQQAQTQAQIEHQPLVTNIQVVIPIEGGQDSNMLLQSNVSPIAPLVNLSGSNLNIEDQDQEMKVPLGDIKAQSQGSTLSMQGTMPSNGISGSNVSTLTH